MKTRRGSEERAKEEGKKTATKKPRRASGNWAVTDEESNQKLAGLADGALTTSLQIEFMGVVAGLATRQELV